MCNFFFIIFLFFSLILFFLGFLFLNLQLEVYLSFNILYFNSVRIEFSIILDWISLVFISFVFFISAIILLYRAEYIYGDKNLNRFVILIVLFVTSIMIVILSSNLVSILLGWDGLGLVSYALVIYYQNPKSYNAGILTALSNRVGDAALLIGIACIVNWGGWNFLFYLDYYRNKIFLIIALFIILASITKSAQIPFSAWLPAAIAAPTPVSSLVHSSTLVTAGVYILFRFSSIFTRGIITVLLYISLLTIFIAGLGAVFEFDLKKIIALSTLRQLGIIIAILCLGNKELAFFHLLVHALFKALLFICAGAIIHNLGNCQDIRYIGGIVNFIPITCTCFNIRNFALCGFPFLSGFYSKDLIAEVLSIKFEGLFIYVIFFVSVGFTVIYSIRLSYFILFGEFNILNLNYLNDNNNKIILKGIIGLVLLVIFKGSLLLWVLFPTPYFIVLPFYIKILTLIIILAGVIIGYEVSKFYLVYINKSIEVYNLSFFLSGIWNLPLLSTYGLNSYFLKIGKFYFKTLDQGWIEYYGRKNLGILIIQSRQFLQLLSRNHIKIFLIMILTVLFFLVLMVLYLNSL